MDSGEIRQRFARFFAAKDHEIVPSAPLLPQDDPTLLFVNAGMVPFKDVFLGRAKRPYTRAASVQKCVRAGGKHNDLENVGRTARHHTFFEMLGNFSFGDYGKAQACAAAWEFLTREMQLDPARLHVTVFGGEGKLEPDEETESIWRDEVGVPKQRIKRCGAADNFWAMGARGPCGPCSEIHYDRRGDTLPAFGDDPAGDTLVELWNLVFMQHERQADGSLTPLPSPCVDTGMGLERLCMVSQGVVTNYETDLLSPLLRRGSALAGVSYKASDSDTDVSLRVLADHSRAIAFLIADGVLPAPDGRGYVLRRILRRAVRHGDRLELRDLFLHELCAHVVEQAPAAYPELARAAALIERVVRQEETAFRRTLQRGLSLFATQARALGDAAKELKGDTVFRLHETYGFPPDLTAVLARERGLRIDWAGFDKAKKQHEAASGGELGLRQVPAIYKELALEHGATTFREQPQDSPVSRVLALLDSADGPVPLLEPGRQGVVILDHTPFYGESGGQEGDKGELLWNGGGAADVTDTKKAAGVHLHHVAIRASSPRGLTVGDPVRGSIDDKRRWGLRCHHSATHLLHSALRAVLGGHVTQKGSLVQQGRLRFDFSHFAALTAQQVQRVEQLVNASIWRNDAARVETMTLDQAKARGAMALFGEKYGDTVRVVRLGPESLELCGGTHVARTGDIGAFVIAAEQPLSAGVRRIEALVGESAMQAVQRQRQEIQALARLLAVPPRQAAARLRGLLNQQRDLQRRLAALQAKQATQDARHSARQAHTIRGIRVICQRIDDNLNAAGLRAQCDAARAQLKSGLVVLATAADGGKWNMVVGLTPDLVGRYHAGKLASALAALAGGRGGGRADFAQAGGTDVALLEKALQEVEQVLA
ncbi:MAG: alanine--tRNA ligase [Myxococcota bacterium]